jgi:hypothetical protein
MSDIQRALGDVGGDAGEADDRLPEQQQHEKGEPALPSERRPVGGQLGRASAARRRARDAFAVADASLSCVSAAFPARPPPTG